MTTRRPAPPRPEWIDDVMQTLPPMLTVEETAEVLRMAPETVRRHCRSGELRAVQQHFGRGGSPLLIPRTSVADWLVRHEFHPQHSPRKG